MCLFLTCLNLCVCVSVFSATFSLNWEQFLSYNSALFINSSDIVFHLYLKYSVFIKWQLFLEPIDD